MNYLAQMLLGAPIPPPPKHKPRVWVTSAANDARRTQALARYRAAMGEGWVKKIEIDSRLGLSRSSSDVCLNKWKKMGLVECRPVGGEYANCRGYEWRWIK